MTWLLITKASCKNSQYTLSQLTNLSLKGPYIFTSKWVGLIRDTLNVQIRSEDGPPILHSTLNVVLNNLSFKGIVAKYICSSWIDGIAVSVFVVILVEFDKYWIWESETSRLVYSWRVTACRFRSWWSWPLEVPDCPKSRSLTARRRQLPSSLRMIDCMLKPFRPRSTVALDIIADFAICILVENFNWGFW